jgi:hypothetical protein
MGARYLCHIAWADRWRKVWLDLQYSLELPWLRTCLSKHGGNGVDGAHRRRAVSLGVGIRARINAEIPLLCECAKELFAEIFQRLLTMYVSSPAGPRRSPGKQAMRWASSLSAA